MCFLQVSIGSKRGQMCLIPPEAGVIGYRELLDVGSGNWTQRLCKNKTSFNWWWYFISLDSFKIEWFRVNFFFSYCTFYCCCFLSFVHEVVWREESRIWCWVLSSGKLSANGVWGFYLFVFLCVHIYFYALSNFFSGWKNFLEIVTSIILKIINFFW